MELKFIIDECIGPRVAHWLQENNYDVVSIYDDLRGTNDDSVLLKAISEKRILITADKDFGDMIFQKQLKHSGIILLRLSDERAINKILVLERLLKEFFDHIYGNFIVATEKSVRISKPKDYLC